MSTQLLTKRSLELITDRLLARRDSASQMAETLLSGARQARETADNSDRLDSATLIGTASQESFALAAHAEGIVREVDLALGRIADGTYGLCDGCDGTIPIQRLRALPATTLCIGCKTFGRKPTLRVKISA